MAVRIAPDQSAICFVIQNINVAVAADAVALIEDIQLALPPPLSQAWVGGVAVGEKMSVAVDLAGKGSSNQLDQLRTVKVARMKTVAGCTPWCMEIDRAGGLCRIAVHAAEVPPEGWPVPSDWFFRASDETGRTLLWFDVRRVQDNFKLT